MTEQNLEQLSSQELIRLITEQEAALSTYKETLSRIYQEFDAKIEELSLIRRVSDVLRQTNHLTDLGLGLVEVVFSELNADMVSLFLTDPEMERLWPAAAMQRDWEKPRPINNPAREETLSLDGELGQAINSGRALIINDLSKHPALEENWPEALPGNARSLLGLPLVARQQVLGMMLLLSFEKDAFGEQQTRALTIICDHAAAALVNARLIDMLGEINERLLASELEAHQAREYLQHLLDTAGDLILIADSAGYVTYANQAASEVSLNRDELLGANLADIFADHERADYLFRQNKRLNEELELAGPGGEIYSTLVSTTPLPDSGEIMVFVRDITRRKALERQLVHAEKLASVGMLAAGVAHEIGNPLSAVSGYAQLLTKDDIDPADRHEFASAIADQAERINRIIRELLDYSRPSPSQGQLIDLNQAVESVLDMFFTSKRLNHLEIVRDFDLNLPLARIDRDQLQQVVLNIVMNAAQAMEEQEGLIRITTRKQDQGVAIIISDNGPGIAPAHLAVIFEPFFTTKPVGKGTGLGLSISERIISAAGGRIEAQSALGQGTAFTIWLPAEEEPGPAD